MIYTSVLLLAFALLLLVFVINGMHKTIKTISQHEQKEDTKVHMSASEYLKLIK